jgi:hypothetical protein
MERAPNLDTDAVYAHEDVSLSVSNWDASMTCAVRLAVPNVRGVAEERTTKISL